ncbi:MAG TPA: invasin domain 3-containing protein, partial [Acidimicrobiales bacterium]
MRRLLGAVSGLLLVLGVLTVTAGVAQAAGTSVNVVAVEVGDYQDIVAPSASHPTATCAVGPTECGQVEFPGNFSDPGLANYPGSTIGNTPSCQQQYGPACDATPSLGDWFYDVEPTDDAGLVADTDTITLDAPVGTTFPTDPADYLLAPLCTTPEDDQDLPSNDNLYSNIFDGANGYDGDFVCSDSLTNGTVTVGQGPASFSTTGHSVTLGMPFNVSFIDDGTYFGHGNSFGVFITGVTNPPANSYPAQDFGVTTTEQPTFPGFPLNNAGVTFTNGPVAFSSLTASPTTLAVSTTSPTYLTASVVDNWGNPVPNEDVYVQPEPGSSAGLAPGFTPPTSTQSDGTALFEYVDTKAQSVTFEVLDFSTSTVLPPTQVVKWVAGVPTQGLVTVAPSTVPADGVTTALVTAYLADQYGNPDTGVPVTLMAESHTEAAANVGVFNNGIVSAGDTSCLAGGPQIPGESCTAATPRFVVINGSPVATGAVTFTVADPTAEDVIFGLDDLSTVAGAELTSAPFQFSVDFAPGPPTPGQSTILPATQSVLAGGSGGTIKVTLRDAKKNPVPGLAVSLGAQGTSSSTITPTEILNSASGCQGLQASAGTTDCNGQVAFSVKDTSLEDVKYVASYSGSTDGQSVSGTVGPVTVDFVAGRGDAATSTVVASPTSALANGTAAPTVTVTLKDANGDPASGRAVTLSQPSGDHSVITPTQIPDSESGCATQAQAGTSDCSGQVAFAVTDTTPESVAYAATDTTDSPPDGVVIIQTATVGFTTTPTLATSTIVASPTSVPADGSTSSLVTVTLKDASGNPI